jgi:enamine deaminase RidA (YjgF/YER057c/UK114 family)
MSRRPVSARLAALGLVLPAPPAPLAAYVPAVRTGDLLFVSGMLPLRDGAVLHPGALGREVSVEQGAAAARQAALNGLAVVAQAAGSLERIDRIVRLNGFVASAPAFTQQPQVLNGASELLASLLGEAGRHSRIAVGVAVLPLNAPVELDLVVQLRPARRSRPRR